MRIIPPSNASVNNIHHHDQLTTFVNFKITNISVNIFNSFLTHYDYIPIQIVLQLINHQKNNRPIWPVIIS